MKLSQLKNSIESGALLDSFKKAYVTDDFAKAQYDRYLKTAEAFAEVYGDEDREICLFSAPGRSEVCGNHTDHNHGCVLAAGISLDAVAVASKNDTNTVNIKSAGYKMDTVSCDDLCVNCTDTGRSKSLVRGMMARFVELGYNIGGFDATTSSKVLSGSGLSSSAAFEVLVGTMLNYLFNDGKISPVEIAQIAQYAENIHFGKPCGLMDQIACAAGGFVAIDFADTKNPIVEKLPFDLDKYGVALCIVNTGGNHADLNDDYASIPSDMKKVANLFGKDFLRNVEKSDVIARASEIREKLGDKCLLRALHFLNENERVTKQRNALSSGDLKGFLSGVRNSGLSSATMLQNVYTVKNVNEQGLSVALALSGEVLNGVEGAAYRVHGGGFAGTIQAFVPKNLIDTYRQTLEGVFGEGNVYVLSVRKYGAVCIDALM